jgi:hypothetical protein
MIVTRNRGSFPLDTSLLAANSIRPVVLCFPCLEKKRTGFLNRKATGQHGPFTGCSNYHNCGCKNTDQKQSRTYDLSQFRERLSPIETF